MSEQIKDGGPAFPWNRDRDPMEALNSITSGNGMTLRDYAEIHFASAWAIALGTSDMNECRAARTTEANRLARIQADEFIAVREAKP